MYELMFMAAGHMAALRAPARVPANVSRAMCFDSDLHTRGTPVIVPLAICLVYAVIRSSYVLWIQGATVRILRRELTRVSTLLLSVVVVHVVPWRSMFTLRYVLVSYFALQFLTSAPWGSPLAWLYISYCASVGPPMRLLLLEWLISGGKAGSLFGSPCAEAVHIAAGAVSSLVGPVARWAWRVMS